jgi:hypothetical protein
MTLALLGKSLGKSDKIPASKTACQKWDTGNGMEYRIVDIGHKTLEQSLNIFISTVCLLSAL